MRHINPPFLELSFYDPRQQEADLFAVLAAALTASGEIKSPAQALAGPRIRHKRVDFHAEPLIDLRLDRATLPAALDNVDLRLTKLHVQNGTKLTPAIEVVTYVDVDPSTLPNDTHPVAIWTEGTDFDPFQPEPIMRRKGKLVYRLFRMLVERTLPAYATITVEYGLENLSMLRIQPISYAFVDFYLNETLFGARLCQQVQSLFSTAYSQRWSEGCYYSGTQHFNPARKSLDRHSASNTSCAVARLLAESRVKWSTENFH